MVRSWMVRIIMDYEKTRLNGCMLITHQSYCNSTVTSWIFNDLALSLLKYAWVGQLESFLCLPGFITTSIFRI